MKKIISLSLCNLIIIGCCADNKTHKEYINASTLYNIQQYEEAIILLDNIIMSNPKYDSAYCLRGDCHNRISERYLKALAWRTEDRKYYFTNKNNAIRDYSTAISLNDKYVDAYYRRARCLSNYFGLKQEEINDYINILTIDPSHPMANYYMGGEEEYRKNYRKAIEYLTRTIDNQSKIDTNSFFNEDNSFTIIYAYHIRGEIFSEIGEINKAKLDMEKADQSGSWQAKHWLEKNKYKFTKVDNTDRSKQQEKYSKISIVKSNASSELSETRENMYKSICSYDGKPETAWQEGVDGHGVGEWIQFDFRNQWTIKKIRMLNGYCKYSKSGVDRHPQNSRIKTALLHFSDKTTQEIHLTDTREYQEITINPVSTSSIKLEIKDYYPGSKWSDNSLSEIEFYGN